MNTPVSAGTLPSGTGHSDPTLSYNLTGVSDWSTQMPFLDIARNMRPFVEFGDWSSHQALVDGGYLDANGWPIRIPDGVKSIGTIWAWGGVDQADTTAAESRAGVYVLTYEGEGTIKLGLGAKVLSSEPGRIVFENTTGTQMAMSITATDPNGTGDYVRDISVVNEKYEGLFLAGQIFNPDFLSVVEDARELRFMDWMNTNKSTVSDWADRPQVDDATWSGQGVPVEVMVQLANQTGTDPWFTMPAQASDDYIRNFATYVRDHLDPGLTVHVEYGNENWNWSFQNTRWLADQAQAEWGVTGGTSWINYAAMRATQTAQLWDQVFADEADVRVDNVLGVQSAYAALANQQLTAPMWQAHDPDGYVSPASVFDSIAGTTYFGYSIVGNADLRSELIELIKTAPATAVNAWLTAQLTDPNVDSSIPQVEQQWAALKDLADQYGLNLTAYEGGQHVQHAFAVQGLTQDDLAKLTNFLTDYIRSPAMAQLYQQLWDAWSQVSDGPFMQLGDVSATSKYGSWGLLSALGDSNPRAELLNDLNQSTPSWFGDGGGTQYQQGVIKIAGDAGEVLTGTAKQDFLVGGAGNDTFIAGAGNDGINGGDGIDTVVLAGKAAQFKLAPEGTGYRLTGPEMSVYVINIERFEFDGEVTKTLVNIPKG
jgi:hypothetical protein